MGTSTTTVLPPYSVRVYYADTDAGGVAHHSAYLRWFEQARAEWLCGMGYSARELQSVHGVALAVVEATLHYLKPAALDDRLQARGSASLSSRCSLLVSQAVANEETSLARADFKLACVDIATQRLSSLPSSLRAALSGDIVPA